MLIYISFFLILTLGRPSVYHDINAGRNGSFTMWCAIIIEPSHRGYSGNQPPDEWTNFTVSIFPYIAKEFQITGSKDRSKTQNSGYIVSANSYTLDEFPIQIVNFTIFWWYNVFPIYLGMLDPTLVNFTKSKDLEKKDSDIPFCDVTDISYGQRPNR